MAVVAEPDPVSVVMTTTLSSIMSNTSNSSDATPDDEDPAWGLVAMITTSCILGVVILTTVIGE